MSKVWKERLVMWSLYFFIGSGVAAWTYVMIRIGLKVIGACVK